MMIAHSSLLVLGLNSQRDSNKGSDTYVQKRFEMQAVRAGGVIQFDASHFRLCCFNNTESQELDVREIPFENVHLVQGEYSGMPIVAVYDPNTGTDLYALLII